MSEALFPGHLVHELTKVARLQLLRERHCDACRYPLASQQFRQTGGRWLVLMLLFTLRAGTGDRYPKALFVCWRMAIAVS